MSALPSNLVGTITQEQWDAIRDADAKMAPTPLPLFGAVATTLPNARRARCRKRAEQWQSDMHRAAAKLMVAYPDDSDTIAEHLEREIDAGPDFTRRRRGSDFHAPPKVNTDRNYINKLMFMADMIERRTWERKDAGKHGGIFGRSALTLFRVLLYVVNKSNGTLFPSYDTLARLCRMSRRTVISAMAVLIRMKFVTAYSRCKRIQTPFGIKCVQDSNAYTYHLPPTKGAGSFAWLIFRTTSECKRFAAKLIKDTKKAAFEKELQERGQAPPGSPPPAAQGMAA
jgi:Helix-turn-helix domain